MESCVLRTYGPWWLSLPSTIQFHPTLRNPLFISQDFIEVCFEQKVQLETVNVFETYHPGSLVALYGFDYIRQKWVQIWSVFSAGNFRSNEAARRRQLPPKISRKFRLDLSQKIYTDKLRLELEHSNMEYYAELDAVEAHGQLFDLSRATRIVSNIESIVSRIELISMDGEDRDEPKKQAESSLAKSLIDNKTGEKSHHNFTDLPFDILIMIIYNLDLKSLFNLRSTCRTLYNICSDERFFRRLNLQPFWNSADDQLIKCLSNLKLDIKMLNLSWTKLDSNLAQKLLISSCKNLTHLLLDSCKYAGDDVIDAITTNCSSLTHLSLTSCRNISASSFEKLKSLKRLTNLNLYRTFINQNSITEIIKSCHELKCLNLGSCGEITDFDSLMETISAQGTQFECLDLWRAYTLTQFGMGLLSSLSVCLQELDIGWCRGISSLDWLETLTTKNKNLRKIFLTSLRISERELEIIAKNCENLEQIDVLGSISLSANSIETILKNCKNLKLLDVSFCTGLDIQTYQSLCERYKNCSIKKSFTNS